MSATPETAYNQADHCRTIATIPRKRSKQASIWQSRMAATLGAYAKHGHPITEETKSLWISAFNAGVRAALKWPRQATSTASTEQPKQKRPRKS